MQLFCPWLAMPGRRTPASARYAEGLLAVGPHVSTGGAIEGIRSHVGFSKCQDGARERKHFRVWPRVAKHVCYSNIRKRAGISSSSLSFPTGSGLFWMENCGGELSFLCMRIPFYSYYARQHGAKSTGHLFLSSFGSLLLRTAAFGNDEILDFQFSLFILSVEGRRTQTD